MATRIKIFFYITFYLLSPGSHGQDQKSLAYLNQKPPGIVPEIFAPGLVSRKDQHEFGSVFSRDGKEFFYAVDHNGKAEIRYMKLEKDKWTLPGKLLSSEKYSFNDPAYTPDEKRLFFISDIPADGVSAKKDYDIWFIEKTADNWSMPRNAGRPVNSSRDEYYISFTKNGTLYFSSNANADENNKNDFDIYTSHFIKGDFVEPQRLGDSINTRFYEADVFVAPDESYLIFCSERPGGFGKGDLYISFRTDEGHWSMARNMGKTINTEGHELCPFVSRDGKYFFYTSNRDIYWVDASILDDFR